MGGATKARLNDSKPILDGYYKTWNQGIILVVKETLGYTITTNKGTTYQRLTDETNKILISSTYLGSNIDSINILYKE